MMNEPPLVKIGISAKTTSASSTSPVSILVCLSLALTFPIYEEPFLFASLIHSNSDFFGTSK
ncbi:Uncharacterised protein [Chlamydia abortus]|nr:Uncharacterised protein [Chlamydia abortus]SGA33496.1 Uncharacterised protein [Chlamydia abortus]